MKKITFLVCALFAISGVSQTFDFKTQQNALGWGPGTQTLGASIVTEGLEVTWAGGGSNKPKINISTASINVSNKILAITLFNNSAEPIDLQVKYPKSSGSGDKFDLSSESDIPASVTSATTYYYNLDDTEWNGHGASVVNDFELQLRDTGNTGRDDAGSTGSGSIIFQKIEFISSAKYDFLFNTGTGTDGFTTENGSATINDGVYEFTPTIGQNPKIIQSAFTQLESDVSHVHITYKNESATNNELRITWTSSTGTNGGKQWTIGTSETAFTTRTYALGDNAGQWDSGNEASVFTISIREGTSNTATDAGLFKIQSVVFSNSSTPPNYFSADTNSDWATSANWSLYEVPTSGSSDPVNDVVTIPSGSTAVIGSSTAAAVTDLTVNAAGSLSITGGGSLIVSGTSSGNVTYNRTLTSKPANEDGWHLVSSPVAGEVFDNDYVTNNSIASGSGNNRGVATYTSGWTYLQSGGSISSASGIGYSMKRSADGTVGFTGTINTADVNGVTVSASATDFVLLGVPYTAYMSSADFLTANTNLDQSQIWIWEQGTTGGNYIANTAKADNFILAPGQGFFVKKANTTATVNFAESNQQSNADTFKKSSRTEVKLLVSDGNIERFAKMYYLNNVTKGYDLGYEGETFGGVENKFDIFSHLVEENEGKSYQVQSLPLSEMESTIVPLGLKVTAEQEITFTAEALNVPTGYKVYLEDRLNNIFTRLDEVNTKYTTTVTETSTDGRFYLHTRSNALSTDSELLNTVSIYKSNATTLRIVGLPQGKANLKLYNVLGKQVMNSNFNAQSVKEFVLPKLSTGVYIVQLETEAGNLNKKIVLE